MTRRRLKLSFCIKIILANIYSHNSIIFLHYQVLSIIRNSKFPPLYLHTSDLYNLNHEKTHYCWSHPCFCFLLFHRITRQQIFYRSTQGRSTWNVASYRNENFNALWWVPEGWNQIWLKLWSWITLRSFNWQRASHKVLGWSWSSYERQRKNKGDLSFRNGLRKQGYWSNTSELWFSFYHGAYSMMMDGVNNLFNHFYKAGRYNFPKDKLCLYKFNQLYGKTLSIIFFSR